MLQITLFFLQFSAFDRCEVGNHTLRTFIINSVVRIFQKAKIAIEVPAKIKLKLTGPSRGDLNWGSVEGEIAE